MDATRLPLPTEIGNIILELTQDTATLLSFARCSSLYTGRAQSLLYKNITIHVPMSSWVNDNGRLQKLLWTLGTQPSLGRFVKSLTIVGVVPSAEAYWVPYFGAEVHQLLGTLTSLETLSLYRPQNLPYDSLESSILEAIASPELSTLRVSSMRLSISQTWAPRYPKLRNVSLRRSSLTMAEVEIPKVTVHSLDFSCHPGEAYPTGCYELADITARLFSLGQLQHFTFGSVERSDHAAARSILGRAAKTLKSLTFRMPGQSNGPIPVVDIFEDMIEGTPEVVFPRMESLEKFIIVLHGSQASEKQAQRWPNLQVKVHPKAMTWVVEACKLAAQAPNLTCIEVHVVKMHDATLYLSLAELWKTLDEHIWAGRFGELRQFGVKCALTRGYHAFDLNAKSRNTFVEGHFPRAKNKGVEVVVDHCFEP